MENRKKAAWCEKVVLEQVGPPHEGLINHGGKLGSVLIEMGSKINWNQCTRETKSCGN